ncbi:MAG: hypothetical protein JO282_08000 [Alphaproteobacteria bacterium]|nr:hypothetical protein [Alphaproteobacteria bacterium]
MQSVDEDSNGNLGLTWMESSNSEYLTMWVGTIDPPASSSPQIGAAGAGFFFATGRIGDDNTTVLDQSR